MPGFILEYSKEFEIYILLHIFIYIGLLFVRRKV